MAENGFLSYAHADDEAEGGRVSALAQDLENQYKLLTGQPLTIFLDATHLGWGNDWEATIDQAVVATRFFIPVVTPTYLMSEQCRREFQLFVRTAESLGLSDLVLPLLWVDVAGLGEPTTSEDEVVTVVKKYQWVDWRELRFEERGSGAYRRAVSALATRLSQIAPAPDLVSQEVQTVTSDSEPGLLDHIAASESALPRLAGTLQDVEVEIVAVGELATEASEAMSQADARKQGAAGRLTAARIFAQKVSPHAQKVEELGAAFASDLYDLDGGVRATLASFEASPTDDPTEIQARKNYAESIARLVPSAREGLGAISSLVTSILPLEGLSRDLRPPLQQLRKGLSLMAEGQQVMDGWEEPAARVLADASSE